MEVTTRVIIVAGVVGLDGAEVVDVDADMVVVGVQHVVAQDGVKLDGKDVVARVAKVLLPAEEAEELVGVGAGHVLGRGDEEGEAMGAHAGGNGADGEHESGGEGRHRGVEGRLIVAEVKRGRVESLAFELGRAIGEVEEAIWGDLGQAIDDDV